MTAERLAEIASEIQTLETLARGVSDHRGRQEIAAKLNRLCAEECRLQQALRQIPTFKQVVQSKG